MAFRVWGDYLLIRALVKGNYWAGLGSGAKSATLSAPLCQIQVTRISEVITQLIFLSPHPISLSHHVSCQPSICQVDEELVSRRHV